MQTMTRHLWAKTFLLLLLELSVSNSSKMLDKKLAYLLDKKLAYLMLSLMKRTIRA